MKVTRREKAEDENITEKTQSTDEPLHLCVDQGRYTHFPQIHSPVSQTRDRRKNRKKN